MSSSKWGLGCALVTLLTALYLSQAFAQGPGPEGGLAPGAQPKPQTERVENSKQSKADDGAFCQCVDQPESAAVARIERALAAPLHSTGAEFTEQPLKEVLMQFQEEYNFPIQLNVGALEEAAIGSDSPVTVSLHNISLKSALKLLLEPLQLTYVIRDEVLVVTTKDDADKQLVTCVYNVQGLIDQSDPQSIKSLIEAIERCVATDTWVDYNDKNVADLVSIKPGLLVVSQTPAVQDEVRGLLMKIRKVREQVPVQNDRAKTPDSKSKQSSADNGPVGRSIGARGPEGGGFGGQGNGEFGRSENPFGN
jgi:hypothetical protein